MGAGLGASRRHPAGRAGGSPGAAPLSPGHCWLSTLRAGNCQWPGSHRGTRFPWPPPYTRSSPQPLETQSPKPLQPASPTLPFSQGDSKPKGWGKARQSPNRVSPSLPPRASDRDPGSKTNSSFSFYSPMRKVFIQVKFFTRKTPAGEKRSFCRVHHTALVPERSSPCARQAGAELQAPTARAAGEPGQLQEQPRHPPKGEGSGGRAA